MCKIKKNNKSVLGFQIILKIIIGFGILFTFLILDVGMRYLFWRDVGFVSYRSFSPLLFSISYILLLLILMTIFYNKRKIIYVVFGIMANVYFIAQFLCYKILGNFFSIVNLFSAGEASDYLEYAFQNVDDKMLILVLLSILSIIIVLILDKKVIISYFYKSKKYKVVSVVITLVLFIICRIGGIYKLGSSVSNGAWDSWKIPRNVYDNYSNNNRSFMVSGMYEYIFRDAYLYLKKRVNPNTKQNVEDINKYLDTLDIELEDNDYTGIFKNKNLIVIMMESIDDWLVDEEVMPTLSKLSNSGINFTNRYAPFFGGAMTINSEFASVSGLYSVVSEKAIYNYNNNFDYSLPSLFKENGYIVNSIHMNNAEFYNRKNFHLSLGFDHHFALYNMGLKSDFSFDSNIILDDDSFELIISKDKFMTFITTYSAHVPYSGNSMCDKLKEKNIDLLVEGDEELSCLRLLANDTDKFLELLIKRLDENNLLNDTVLVMFSDHYSYGYSDVAKIKNTDNNNLIQHTPFVIWSNDVNGRVVDAIVDTADIPVILFNMFGIDYNPKLYMGTDVFSSYHENFVYFSDYTWYDGVNYSEDIEVNDYSKKISEIVSEKININSKIISSDYYNYYK